MTLEQYQAAARDHYIIVALWSSHEADGEPLDATYDIDDIDPETLSTMCQECDQFIAAYWAPIAETGQFPKQCGHDFWLTRNNHGAGFWDRGYPLGLGDVLTVAAHAEGSRDLYVGDDGRIYQA